MAKSLLELPITDKKGLTGFSSRDGLSASYNSYKSISYKNVKHKHSAFSIEKVLVQNTFIDGALI